ncbi:hypothetical protein J0H58_26020 [bacterium]|nr:hypothetical protein [bacterium]
MPQFSRPIADVPGRTGSWTSLPLYEKLDEREPDDADRVTSSSDPVGDAFEVQLAPLAWPLDDTHRLSVRLRKDGPGAVSVYVYLLQGPVIIASRVASPGADFATETVVLTPGERAAITDYTDLRVRVAAGVVVTPCCPGGLPPVLRWTRTGATGTCGCLPSAGTLAWDSTTGAWVGRAAGCGDELVLTLRCWSGTGGGCSSFLLEASCGWGGRMVGPQPGCSCGPLNLVFNGCGPVTPGLYCCSGTFDIAVSS